MKSANVLLLMVISMLLASCAVTSDSSMPTQTASTRPEASESTAMVMDAPPGPDLCTTRDCLMSLVDDYLAALVAGEPGSLPFADDAIFVENVMRKTIGEGLWQSATGLPGEFRIYVPDPVSKQAGFMGLMEVNGEPALLALRLQVEGDGINAAEHIVVPVTSDRALGKLIRPRPGFHMEIDEDERLSRRELLSIGYSYYPALDDNDGTLAPFADDCLRIENGMQTSTNPNAATVFGKMNCGPQISTNYFQYIDSIDNRRVNVADPVTGLVMGLSHFRHGFEQKETPIVGVEGITTRDVSMFDPFDMPAMHIFKVGPEGQIHEIEAVGLLAPYMSPTGWGF